MSSSAGATPSSLVGVVQNSPQYFALVKTTAQRYPLATAIRIRDKAEEAYTRALDGNKAYEVEGVKTTRYGIVELRYEFEYWCDVVNEIQRFGNTNHGIVTRRVIIRDT